MASQQCSANARLIIWGTYEVFFRFTPYRPLQPLSSVSTLLWGPKYRDIPKSERMSRVKAGGNARKTLRSTDVSDSQTSRSQYLSEYQTA